MHWIWFIIVGAIVGALGRLLHRGRDPMGWLLTIAIGVVAMIIAAAISSGWLAFIIGVIVAVILVAIVGRFRSARPAVGSAELHRARSDAKGAPAKRLGGPAVAWLEVELQPRIREHVETDGVEER